MSIEIFLHGLNLGFDLPPLFFLIESHQQRK